MTEPSCMRCRRNDVPLYREDIVENGKIFCGLACQMIGVRVPSAADCNRYADQLRQRGHCVMPVYEQGAELDNVRQRFEQLVKRGMVEYEHDPETGEVARYQGEIKLVGGGFGALGNPSSFHAPIIRDMRADAQRVALPMFRVLAGAGDQQFVEQLVDRARVLRPGAKIGAESWHRDTTPAAKINKLSGRQIVLPDDRIFGGWIALDGPQKFSAITNSHSSSVQGSSRGFDKLDADESARYTEMKNETLERGEPWFIDIPAGHMLIFQQELIHEVVAQTATYESYRLFTGWRLTKSRESFIMDPRDFFDNQGVPNIKSSQRPEMYPSMPWSSSAASRDGLERWSRATFRLGVREVREPQTGNGVGEARDMVPLHMYSLRDIGIKLAAVDWYRRYGETATEQEVTVARTIIFKPPSQWETALAERFPGVPFNRDALLAPFDPAPYMFLPYSQAERAILSPQ